MTRKLVGLGDANHTRHRPKRSATRYRSPLGTCPGPPCFSSVKFTATANGLLDSPLRQSGGHARNDVNRTGRYLAHNWSSSH